MVTVFTVLAYCLCIACIIRLLSHEKIVSRVIIHQRDSALDGLRGLLATIVMTHHFFITYIWKHTGYWVRPESDILNNFGSVGVSFFFLITGYLFVGKIYRQDVNWAKLYRSRIRRIVPLFYVVVILIVILTLMQLPIRQIEELSYRSIIKWLISWVLFMGSSLEGYPSGIIIAGVNWTLIYEWFFYFSLPLLSLIIGKNRCAYHGGNLFFLLICTGLLYLLYDQINMMLLLLFGLGGITALLPLAKFPWNWNSTLITLIIILLCIILFSATSAYTYGQMFLCGIIFTAFVANNTLFGLLKLSGLKVLGEISYSIYLTHGLILFLLFTQFSFIDIAEISYRYYLLFYPLVFMLVVITSLGTYLSIERIFLRSRKRIYHNP